jgi:hypothetical protein
MKALSIMQPWAWLICAGYKDIENRNWFIGRKVASGMVDFKLKLPARIYVHAGKNLDDVGLEMLLDEQRLPGFDKIPMVEDLKYGAIIGEATITGCVEKSDSPWFVGKYGFVLSQPTLYNRPIPCRGALGFFEPEIK